MVFAIPAIPAAVYWLMGALGVATVAASPAGQQAIRQTGQAISRARERLREGTAEEECEDCPCKRTMVISRSASPQAAQHILDAQAAGQPTVLTLDRDPVRVAARRSASTSKLPTMPGMDRDEYPPATFAEGGATASVRHIPRSDNRSAGGQMTSQLTGVPEGCKITVLVGP
jgi:hypothetical protein